MEVEDVTKVAVLGAGNMGHGIAEVVAIAGFTVVMRDITEELVKKGYEGELDILVSTPVVEVGIDVANATVMMIDGADRFGLAQLHQFRGRVGRGEHKSYCILMSDSASEAAKERLSALAEIHDGFQLAEVDLKLRGPDRKSVL